MAKYLHVLDRLINTPLAISSAKMEVLTSNVILKILSGESIDNSSPTPEEEPIAIEDRIAIITIAGSMANKNCVGSSGMTTYTSIKTQIKEAIAEGVTDIIFDISSPGGEVGGLFPLTDYIATLPKWVLIPMDLLIVKLVVQLMPS